MKYRNKKTGVVFESKSVCVGADIECLDIPAKVETVEEKPKKKTSKKK